MPGRFSADLVLTPLPGVVANAFFVAAERIKDMSAPMEEATRIISDEIKANFDAQGRPGKWPALAESTTRKKTTEGLDPRILQATQALYEGVSRSWDIGQEGGGTWVAVLDDPTGYGFFHLEGTKWMPVRDWAFVPDDAIDAIEQAFYEWLEETTEPIGAV